jgi:hypothetical protein
VHPRSDQRRHPWHLRFHRGHADPGAESGESVSIFYTGQVVIRTDDGRIVGTDAGVIDFATGAFVDLTTISPGQSTGKWAGATSQLRFSGSCDLAAGVYKSEYSGTIQRN